MLGDDRQTVHATLNRCAEGEFAGLPDKSRAPHRRGTKDTLRAIATVKDLQENPLLGEFRVHAPLKRLGIFLSPRTCGHILARNRSLYGLPKPARTPRERKPMPFNAVRRHGYWSADIRYLDHGLGGFKVYAMTIPDNYSRAIVASGLSAYQPDQRRLKAVTPERLFETPHRSPQPPLWARDDDWRPVLRLPASAPRRPQPQPPGATQPPFFPLDEVGA